MTTIDHRTAAGTVLICTVGGSHEPIVKAIRERQPAFVCFVCSEDDLASGKAGSYTQIEGKGHIIKARPADDKPSLPNIPSQVGLAAERLEVARVPADDLQGAFAVVQGRIRALKARFPDSRLLADYTGGTKTMTAALVVAALEEGVDLQVVTGSRVDLVKVRSGMEAVLPTSAEQLRVERAMAPFRAAWARYAYGEAAKGLAGIASPQASHLRAELQIWRDVSRALDAWDRFDHSGALELLDAYDKRIGPVQPLLLATLRSLTDTRQPDRQEALQLFDLWRNAQRRAVQGRFDDAVARVYRLLEWTAQWLLRRHLGIDTADVPPDRLPPEFGVTPNREGKYQLGLFQAWRLAGSIGGPVEAFVKTQLERLQDQVKIRNHSILAHGYTPITEQQWLGLSEWVDEAVLPLLEAEAKAAGIRSIPSQLPTGPCWHSEAA